jgi:hypothetical protein
LAVRDHFVDDRVAAATVDAHAELFQIEVA